MVKLLAAASVAWPMVLGAVVWQRAAGGENFLTVLVHASAAHICHQRPERSFHTSGVQWPVCGRCSGLYLGAPIGALFALASLGEPRGRRRLRLLLAAAALPTAVTLFLEWASIAPVSNLARFVAALPLGAVVLFAMMHAAAPNPRPRSFSVD